MWAEKIREAEKIRQKNKIMREKTLHDTPAKYRIYKNRKPDVSEIYIINYTLSVPETLLYGGAGDTVWGFSKSKLIEIDSLLKNDKEIKLPAVIKISCENIDIVLDYMKNTDTHNCLDTQFVEAGIIPGMMIDKYH